MRKIISHILGRDFSGGQMARDMTLFVDADGKAYHIYSSEENNRKDTKTQSFLFSPLRLRVFAVK